MNINRRLLLHGAIGKDRGNGLQFYTALEAASEAELREALGELNKRYGGIYGYHGKRRRAIQYKLAELEKVSA